MKEYKKEGLLLEQREDNNELLCFAFIEEVGELINMLTVARIDDGDKEGYQRLIKCVKIKSISKFLDKDNKNIIPNSITIAIDKDLNCDVEKLQNDSILKFNYNDTPPPFLEDLIECKGKHVDTDGSSTQKKPLIIDGQHRLYGLYKNNPKNKVLVSAIINPELVDQAFQFIVINQKSQKANTVDVKSVINSDGYDDELKDRLVQVGITYGNSANILDYFNRNESSPFLGILDWSNNSEKKKRIVPINTVEQIYRICNLETRGVADESQLLEFISIMWNKVKSLFKDVWNNTIEDPKYSNILKKASLQAITEYLLIETKSKMRELNKPILEFTKEEIELIVDNNLGKLDSNFFTVKWRSGLDTPNGRETIKDSINQSIENSFYGNDWDYKVSLIDKTK